MSKSPPLGLVLRGNTPQITLAGGSETSRDALISRLSRIRKVSSAAELALATEVIREAKAMLKLVEASRKEVKQPLIAAGRQIEELAQGFVSPLSAELDNRQRLVDAYVAEQEAKRQAAAAAAAAEAAKIEEARAKAAAAAEAKLQADLAKARTEAARAKALERAEERQAVAADAASMAYASLPMATAMARPEGLSVRTEAQFELLDVQALLAARPDLCNVEPNGTAIRAALRAGLRACPGLRIWESTKAVVRS